MDAGNIVADTSILIDHFRSRQKDNTILFKLSEKHALFISSVTQFEFLVGTKPEQMKHIKAIIDVFQILPFDSKCAEIASNIVKSLKAEHQHAEFRDVFIAATAAANKMPLVTLNIKHFKKINEVELFSYKTA